MEPSPRCVRPGRPPAALACSAPRRVLDRIGRAPRPRPRHPSWPLRAIGPVVGSACAERPSRRRSRAAPGDPGRRRTPRRSAAPIVDLDPLAPQLVHLRPEAAAHLVELARQPRHLVACPRPAPGWRSRPRRSAAPPRASQRTCPLEHPEQHHDEDQRHREEQDQTAPITSGLEEKKPSHSPRREQRHAQRLGAGRSVPAARSVGRRSAPRSPESPLAGRLESPTCELPETGPAGAEGASRRGPSGVGPPRGRRRA